MPITKASGNAVAPAAKGDLVVGSATNDAAVLSVGTNGQYLSANSSTSTGLEWVAAPTSTQNWSQIGGAVSLASNASVTVSGISGADKLMVSFVNVSSATGSAWISLHINNDTTNNNYDHFGGDFKKTASYDANWLGQYTEGNTVPRTGIQLAYFGTANRFYAGTVFINGGNSSGIKVIQGQGGVTGQQDSRAGHFGAWYNGTSTISSLVIKYNGGSTNFSDGYMYVWKSA
jgi:hypothetical protein